MRKISLLFFITLLYSGNIFGQNLNSLPDTLKESDVFGSRNMKMMVVNGVGVDQRKLVDKKDLGLYFDFNNNLDRKGSKTLIRKCLQYYIEKMEDRPVSFDLGVDLTNKPVKETSSPLHHALKLLFKNGYLEKGSRKVYKIERYMLIVQKNKITPSKIYRAKKAIMMGNPILIELKMNEKMIVASPDFASISISYPVDQFFTLLLIGYDINQGVFQGLTSEGNEILVTFNNFMKFVNKGYVIIPKQINK